MSERNEGGLPAQMQEQVSSQELERIPKQTVIIIMGSDKDGDVNHAKEIQKSLDAYGIYSELVFISAHKNPQFLLDTVRDEFNVRIDEGEQLVFIAVAGGSNGLGPILDWQTTATVISCPPPSTKYGTTQMYSSLELPSGMSAGYAHTPDLAAMQAVKVLSYSNQELRLKLIDERKKRSESDKERGMQFRIEHQRARE